MNQRGVSWRKRVFTIITGEGGGEVVELYTGISFRGSRFVFRPPSGRTRGGIDETRGGDIYVLYVYRSGSITDTREILTQDGIPPPD